MELLPCEAAGVSVPLHGFLGSSESWGWMQIGMGYGSLGCRRCCGLLVSFSSARWRSLGKLRYKRLIKEQVLTCERNKIRLRCVGSIDNLYFLFALCSTEGLSQLWVGQRVYGWCRQRSVGVCRGIAALGWPQHCFVLKGRLGCLRRNN